MTLRRNTLQLTALLAMATLLMLGLVGCTESTTSPSNDFTPDTGLTPVSETLTVDDPLADVLKSLDEVTPVEPEACISRLAEVLELTDEQLALLNTAYLTFRSEADLIKEQVAAAELTRDEAHLLIADLRDAFEAEAQLILTPEQYDLLQELRQNRYAIQGRHDHGNRDRELRWGGWMVEIGVDEAQIALIREARDIRHDALQALRQDVRDGVITHQDARLETVQLRADFDAALQEILTPEQYALLIDLRPDCGRPPQRP